MTSMPDLSVVHTISLDFDGVFTDNKVTLSEDGKESVVCSRYDGFAFNLLRKFQQQGRLKAEIFVLSKEPNPVVLSRTKKLKLDCAHGIDDKLSYMLDYFKKRNLDNGFDGLVYLGNDLNDLAVMRRAKLAVAPNDAHPAIKEIASLIMPQNGGQGFIRAFVEQFLGIDQMSLDELEELMR